MRTRRLFALLFVLVSLFVIACSDSGNSDPADGDAPDGDTPDGDTPDGDTPDGDTPDGDTPDGDTPDGDSPQAEPTRFLMGYGEADVSPPLGTVMGGFGAPGGYRGMEEINDPLMAQVALFANDAGQAFMIISLDSAGWFYDLGDWGPGVKVLRETISAALADTLDLPPEHILLTSSHSHAATDLVGFWQEIGDGPPVEVLNAHVNAITAAAKSAAAELRDVTLRFAQTELVGLTGRDHAGLSVVDNAVTILAVENGDGERLLTLTNWAKHPTILPDGNRKGSADFIWGYREELEKASGASAMYLQGYVAALHGGDVSVEGDDNYEEAYNVGARLAEAVLAVDSFSDADRFDIRHMWTTFTSEVGPGYADDMFKMFDMPKRYITVGDDDIIWVDEIEVSWHKLGPAEFVAFPGEPTPEGSLFAREKAASPYVFPIGLANDCIGYIIEEASQSNEGLQGYELKMGLGTSIGLKAWEEMEALGWYDGGWQE